MEKKVFDRKYFDTAQTVECGQVFRYFKIEENNYNIISLDKICNIKSENDKTIITSDDMDYFTNYFDTKTDYGKIVKTLSSFPELNECVNFGKGIHILRQDFYETIISFIISANNNISRIRKIIEGLSNRFGKNMGSYHAFPTFTELQEGTVDDYKGLGLGYRASYMADTVKKLPLFLEEMKSSNYENATEKLLSLKGIGPKVADCITLFGLHQTENYPVDTWIFKANKTEQLDTPKKVREYYMNRYSSLAGFAQQYIFYHARSIKK